MEAEGNEVLDFGDAKAVSVQELVRRADKDIIVNAIALLGPLYLKRFIQARNSDVAFRPQYASLCEMCEHIVSRKEAVSVLEEHMAVLSVQVAVARWKLARLTPATQT
jgi:hypothetical protein